MIKYMTKQRVCKMYFDNQVQDQEVNLLMAKFLTAVENYGFLGKNKHIKLKALCLTNHHKVNDRVIDELLSKPYMQKVFNQFLERQGSDGFGSSEAIFKHSSSLYRMFKSFVMKMKQHGIQIEIKEIFSKKGRDSDLFLLIKVIR